MGSFLIVAISMLVFGLSLALAETAAKRSTRMAISCVVRPIPAAKTLFLRKEFLLASPAPAPKRTHPSHLVHARCAQHTVAIG